LSLQFYNVLVEWLTLLVCIQKVPVSNIGPETDYPDFICVFFSSVLPRSCR